MNKRTLLAFVIIGIVILFYDDYLRLISPPPPETDETTGEVADKQQPSRSIPARESEAFIDAESPTTATHDVRDLALVPPRVSVEHPIEEIIKVETDRFVARFSTRGARLISYTLKPFGRYLKNDIELLHQDAGQHPAFQFWTINGPIETADLSFNAVGFDEYSYRDIRVSGDRTRRLEFLTEFDSSRSLSIIYTFSGSGYTFNCEATGRDLSTTWVRDYAVVYWRGGLAYTESDTAQDLYYSRAYAFFQGGEMQDMKVNRKKADDEDLTTGGTRWGAVRTKYFIAAMIPELRMANGGWMESRIDSSYSGSHPPNLLGLGLRIPLENGAPATPIRMYIGPLDEDILAEVDPDLKRTMNWGWPIIAPFSKFILWSLKHLFNLIPNYGLCVIIFSVLIKVVVWPLTRKSYQSMAAMQRLQPRIQALREKYKSDAARVQKEIMKVYKEEKVNPMGGCLPILLQMPLLYALFIVFRSTIEFRSAPFILWITDLSKPDIIFHLPFTLPMYGSHVALLPILMGISTFFQSKVTMTDPNQKMMLYFMPIFMTLIFNQFPSGLTLYYTLFNVWTLIQQKITPPPRPAAATAEVTTKGR